MVSFIAALSLISIADRETGRAFAQLAQPIAGGFLRKLIRAYQ